MRRILPMLILLAACGSGGEISVNDAWVRAMPPGSGMTAGYFVLTNDTAEDVSIVSASSGQFALVEIHRTVTIDGVSRMQQQEAVAAPAGASVRFEPHGLHLMLMRPEPGLQPGDTVSLSLRLADGREIPFDAAIRLPPN